MRPDRPVIGAVVCLVTGVALIVAYCRDASAASIAFPISLSTLHLDLTTSGPGVPGGLIFVALGVLLLVWSLLAAIVSQIGLLLHREDRMESIFARHRVPAFDNDKYADAMHLDRKHEG